MSEFEKMFDQLQTETSAMEEETEELLNTVANLPEEKKAQLKQILDDLDW